MSDIVSVVLDLKCMAGGGILDAAATASFSVDHNDTSLATFANPAADSEGLAQMQQPHIDLSFLQMGENAWQQELDDTTKGLQLFGKTLNDTADETTRFYGTRGELLKTSWGDTSTATATFGVPKDDLVGELLPELLFILMDIESNLSQLPEILRSLLSSLDALRGVLGGTQASIIGLTNVLNDMSPSVQQLPEQLKGLQKTLDELPKKIQAAIKAAKEDKNGWEIAKDLIDDLDHIKKGWDLFKGLSGGARTVTEGVVTDVVADTITDDLIVTAGETLLGAGLGASILATGGVAAVALIAYEIFKDRTPEIPAIKDTRPVTLNDGHVAIIPKNAEGPKNYQGIGTAGYDYKPPYTYNPDFKLDNTPKKEEKKSEATVKPVTDAIINGGNRVININMNAPMYKVDHQVFQKAEDAVKDFEPKMKEALLRILYSVPAI